MENFIKMQECFGVACSLVRYTLSLGSDRGTQRPGLLGIVEERKKGDQKWHEVMAFLMGMDWEER